MSLPPLSGVAAVVESTADVVPLLDAAAARAGDQAAVAAGDTWSGLMERAGGHLARGVTRLAGRGYGLRVVILVGKGDNGGDGWVAARRLAERGAQARVVSTHPADEPLSDASASARDRWLAAGGRVSWELADLAPALARADVAVDALLGTGASGAPRGAVGDATAALRRARDAGVPVVACDVPSGVGADDGAAPDGAVVADLTVTFGGLKRGLLLHPGAAHAGRVVIGDLGPGYVPPTGTWTALSARGAAPPRLGAAADKRERGVVLVVAGALGTAGAAALSSAGALAAGAGLVTVAVPAPVRTEVAVHHPSAMVHGLPVDADGRLAPEAVEALPDLGGFDAVVAGPGLGHGPGAAAVVAHLRRGARRLVLDADGLNVHRDDPAALAEHAGALVLTPHERELARIGGGADGGDAWAHRVERVPDLARRYDATLVAKGPGTIVAAPDGAVWVTPNGGPALGSGGTGDVLAGMIGAAIAAAAPDAVPEAVARAVWWHAAAGVRAGEGRAARATAVDLLDAVPGVLGELA
ncbi:NAD(P)H-hydrate dehydratase [Egicoccus halophilus]|uniref:Bifunctional NAD(P)H-hydrate repair enzyme n=1 Tax=Egicoccus halophilus TaxID=1670830 RepID=A0A8J3A9X1_9ACTN|nr:NAD(P)H-hydrate dehydratase [Egicoccus halophilus]GGI05897.1 bifunctional NAD(P)H-hydrate repair enzyme [Egicoccus halophilus]